MSAVQKVRRQAVEEALRELEGRGDVALVNLVRAFIQGLEGRVAALELELVEDEVDLSPNPFPKGKGGKG